MNAGTAVRLRVENRPMADMPEPASMRNAAPTMPAGHSPPDDSACFSLWDKYAMLPNVRKHSLVVAHIATTLAGRAQARNIAVDLPHVRAAALLHDIAKSYCVRYGGSHAQLGASWTVAETRNYAVAQAVLLHVHWPWRLPEGDCLCTLPFFIIYADKRVRHDVCVSLDERYEDLLTRYGHSEAARSGIRKSYEQGKTIERAFSALLGGALHEDSFDCGRMVQ
jgi:putative nucleotidyltransferase with HDIG domain